MAALDLKNVLDDPLFDQQATESDKPESDEGLMKRMVLRDEQALTELHRRYAPRLIATLQKLLMEENSEINEAHALVEDAFVQAWQNVHHFNASHVSARGWLVVLALRLVLERSQARGWSYRTLEDIRHCLEGRKDKGENQ